MAANFTIAAAQVPAIRGDFDANLRTHLATIHSAALHGVGVLVFPELSLTGYEPEDAAKFALTPTDPRLAIVRELAMRYQMTISVGVPLMSDNPKPYLGALVFHGDGTTHVYAKMHLGGTEPNYFTPSHVPYAFTQHGQTIGLAICADTSRPEHPHHYAAFGATIYAAGMFLNAEWYATDAPRLAKYAAPNRLLVVLANHAASVGTYVSVGQSAIWAPSGELLAEAVGTETCLVCATYDASEWRGAVVRW